MSPSTAEQTLELPADPASAAAARRAIRELLVSCDHDEWVDAATLAVSELVSNAVLHAHSTVLMVASCGDELRVEVHDQSATRPSQRAYGEQATTGRGMGLVAAVTREHGIDALPDGGKSVWFVIDDGAVAAEPAELGAWDDTLAEIPQAQPGASRVRLLQLPSTLWLAAVQRHDALLRELALLRSAGDGETSDLALADAARTRVEAAVTQAIAAARAAGQARNPLPESHPSRLEEVPPHLDLDVSVAAEDAAGFALLQDVLDDAERLAAAGQMLSRPGLPEVIALRDWVCEQVIAQLNRGAPSPWPGTDAERFTHLEGEGWTVDWDTRQVSESARGAVAADDSNRIVAISRPLAAELGWDPDDLVGRRVVAIVPPRFREAHVAGFTRHLTTGQAHALGVDLDLPVLRADATEVLCSFFIEAHKTPSGRSVYVSWVTPKGHADVSED